MYICVCKGITQNEIQEYLENSSISCPEDVEKACGAGSDCGACRVKLERLFENSLLSPVIPDQAKSSKR